MVITPGQSYSEGIDIPGTSQQQQEAELAAQRDAGCSPKVLDPRTLSLLQPYLKGLIAQSNYASTQLGRHLNTRAPDPKRTAIAREADRLSYSLDALYEDKSPEADRALVYLLRVQFVYSDFGDDNIDCELAERADLTRPQREHAVRPKRADAVRQLLREMTQCLPLTGLEPYPHQMVLPMEAVRKRIKDIPNACERNVDE